MGRTILVIDDSQEFIDLLVLLLSKAGYSVVTARSADKAMGMLELHAPDAILLDVMMPERDGLGFLENLRWNPRFERLPVIVFTAMTLNPEELEFVRNFAQGYLDKAHTSDVLALLEGMFDT